MQARGFQEITHLSMVAKACKSRQRFEDDQLRLCSRKSCCSNFLGHTDVEEAGWMGCSLQSVPHRSALCEEWSGSRKGKEED